MKYVKKIGAILLGICLLFPMFGAMRAHAAEGEIRFSDHTGTKGSTVTVTCTIKCNTGGIGYADVVLLYDPVGLEYVGGSGGYDLHGEAVFFQNLDRLHSLLQCNLRLLMWVHIR